MKVKVIKDYYDLKLKKEIKAGQELDMSEARAQELSSRNNKAGMALVEMLDEEGLEEKKPQVKRKTTKSKKTEIDEVAPVQQESEEGTEEPEVTVGE